MACGMRLSFYPISTNMSQSGVYKWSFIDRVSLAVINFGVNIALARMLTEADFGLLAMISLFVAVAYDLSSCGLSDGLIHKARPTETDYSTVFIFNAAFGLFFGLLFFFTAPLTARFFGHQELIGIMRVLGVCFFLQTMSYVQETRLRKQLRMKAICIVRVGATLTVSVLAIIAAALGYGYWALVCTQLLLSAFFFIYYTIASKWFPRLQFSVKAFKEFFSYGVHLAISYLATIVGRNVNTFILGRLYPTPALSGVYYQGAKLANVPFNIGEYSLNSTFFVVASNEEDPERQRHLVREMFSIIVGINILIMMFMIAISAPGIEFLYGTKWLASIPILRILAVAECLVCIRAFFATICKIHGRTIFVRNIGFIELGIQLLLLLIFCRYGLNVIAWTQAGGVACAVLIYAVSCRRHMGMSLRSIAATFVGTIWLPLLAAAAGIIASSLTPAGAFLRCIVTTTAFFLITITLGELFRVPAYITLKNKLLRKRKA